VLCIFTCDDCYGPMAGAAAVAKRSRRLSSSASAPALPAAGNAEASHLVEDDHSRGTAEPSSAPCTPRTVEVSVEAQEVLGPPATWSSGRSVEAHVDKVACTVTVKAGLTGRNGINVVLRVGLFVKDRSSRLLCFPAAEALESFRTVGVAGVEECDIGRLPSRSRASPRAGMCSHSWVDSGPPGWGGPVVTAHEALELEPSATCLEFLPGLDLRVTASCSVRDDGQAKLRVEVEGELRLQPRFRLHGREAGRRLYATARECFCANDDLKALQVCEEALTMTDGLQPRPPEMGDVLNLMGALHLRRRTPALAVTCLEKALAMRAHFSGAEAAEAAKLASTLSTLGSAHQMLGSYSEALRCLLRAVSILERLVADSAGGDDVAGEGSSAPTPRPADINTSGAEEALASTLHSLGGVYRALGQHVDARRCYEKALSVRERVLGADDPLNAATLNNLGAVLQQLSDDRGAVRTYQRALALQAKMYGKDDCMTAATLSNLGSAHDRVGEHRSAIECHSRALLIQEKHLGADHQGVAATLHNLGNALAAAGRGKDAARCHWRALGIWQKSLGPAHPDIAATLHSLGNVYRGLSEPEAAATCFAGALRIREVALGPTHSETARTRHCAALAACALGTPEAAFQELQAASNTLRSNLGARHPWVLQARADVEALSEVVAIEG